MSTVESSAQATDSEPNPPKQQIGLVPRQRQAWHDLQAAIAERSKSEAAITASRLANDTAADQYNSQAAESLKQKVQSLDQSAREADKDRRKVIVESALAGEESTKKDFARSSRKIAAEFDSAKERARQNHQRDKSNVTNHFNSGEAAATTIFAKARKPIDDATRINQAFEDRLAIIFQVYEKLGLKPASDKPTRETYRFDNLADGLFDQRFARRRSAR